jgi:hypothetical protein
MIFGFFEEGMAWINLRREMKKLGVSAEDAARAGEVTPEAMIAGRAVRKTLGDYNNVSGTERALGLNKLAFFYPFLKTALRLMYKHGLLDPHASIVAPTRGIQANNQIQGYDDPTQPWTATVGRDEFGTPQRYTPPYIGRITENMGRGMALPFDAIRGATGGGWDEFAADAKSTGGIVSNRLGPYAQGIVEGLGTGMGAKFPSHGDFFDSVGPVEKVEGALKGPLHAGLIFGAGGSIYDQPANLTRKQLKEAEAQVWELRRAGHDQEAADLTERIREAQQNHELPLPAP